MVLAGIRCSPAAYRPATGSSHHDTGWLLTMIPVAYRPVTAVSTMIPVAMLLGHELFSEISEVSRQFLYQELKIFKNEISQKNISRKKFGDQSGKIVFHLNELRQNEYYHC